MNIVSMEQIIANLRELVNGVFFMTKQFKLSIEKLLCLQKEIPVKCGDESIILVLLFSL